MQVLSASSLSGVAPLSLSLVWTLSLWCGLSLSLSGVAPLSLSGLDPPLLSVSALSGSLGHKSP